MTETEMLLRFPIGSWCHYRYVYPLTEEVITNYGVRGQVVGYHGMSLILTYPSHPGIQFQRDPRTFVPCDPPADTLPCYGGTGGEP